METHFAVGQKVRSLVTAQGLVKGTKYTVVDTEIRPTMLGTFVHYSLQETPSHAAITIGNGHLLLEEAL